MDLQVFSVKGFINYTMILKSCFFPTSRMGKRFFRFMILTLGIYFITYYIYSPITTKEKMKEKDNENSFYKYTTYYVVLDNVAEKSNQTKNVISKELNIDSGYVSDEVDIPGYLKTVETTPTKISTFDHRYAREKTTNLLEIEHPLPETPVLLVTYLRSGSTLMADIIQQANDVFYIYEPFHSFPQNIFYTGSQICNTTTGRCRYPTSKTENPKVITKTLYNILTCQLQNLTTRIYFDMRFNAKRSKALRKYDNCRKFQRQQPCIEQMEHICRTNPVKSVKVIKVTMEIAEWLIQSIPNLRIIHLLRDPRGMLASQMTGMFLRNDVTLAARTTCNRMKSDIYATLKMKSVYPGRIKSILYEEIAEHPLAATYKLYNFLGLSLTKNITNYVFNITKSGKQSNGYFNVIRGDSAKTAYKWRNKMKWDRVRQIDKECMELYKLAGFNAFLNESNYLNISHKTWMPNMLNF